MIVTVLVFAVILLAAGLAGAVRASGEKDAELDRLEASASDLSDRLSATEKNYRSSARALDDTTASLEELRRAHQVRGSALESLSKSRDEMRETLAAAVATADSASRTVTALQNLADRQLSVITELKREGFAMPAPMPDEPTEREGGIPPEIDAALKKVPLRAKSPEFRRLRDYAYAQVADGVAVEAIVKEIERGKSPDEFLQ